MDVLITGAGGRVGTAITDHLADDYVFTLLDVEPVDGPGETVVADVREYDDIQPHVEAHDAVVHLALMRSSEAFGPGGRGIGWSANLSDNLLGINTVFEAAVDAGVDSLLFASSNHAVGMVEVRNAPEVYHDEGFVAGHDVPHRPDSPYGLTKAYGEDLGRLAAEAHGLRFYGLRLGAVRAPEWDHPFGDAEKGVVDGRWERDSDDYEEQVARMRGLWQSRRDCAHLVDCCLRDESVEWDHFYGVSANDRRWLDDLAYARETVGYDPQDNGEEWDAPPEGAV